MEKNPGSVFLTSLCIRWVLEDMRSKSLHSGLSTMVGECCNKHTSYVHLASSPGLLYNTSPGGEANVHHVLV